MPHDGTALCPSRSDVAPGNMDAVQDWELVGRGLLINEIDRRLADRSCNGVVLTGHPGVGKRRIMAEIRSRWEGRSRQSTQLVAVAGTAAIPFGVLAPLLESSDEPTTATPDHPVTELDLHRLARDALAGTADRPMLVEVVDVSQLDQRSAGVITQLMAERRIRLLASERSDGDPPGVMERLSAHDVVEIPVPTLDDEAMRELVGVALPHAVAPDLVEQLVTLSGGIPFNLGDILDQSLHDEAIALHDGVYVATAALPRSARLNRVLVQQLDRLSQDQRLVIDALAVAGRLDASSLVDLSSESAIDALERRGIIRLSSGGGDIGVTLVRPLTAEVAVENMSVLKLRSLRLAIAERLESSHPTRGDERGRALALRLDADDDVDAEDLLPQARRALERSDYERAERFALAYERVADGRVFEVRQILAEVLSKWGRFEDADRTIAEADVGSDEERLIQRVLRGDYLFWGLDLDADAVEARIDSDGDPLPRRLQAVSDALRCTRRIVSGDLAAADELTRIAGSVHDPERRVRAHELYGTSVGAAMSGRSDTAREAALAGMDEGLGDLSSVTDRHPGEYWLLHAYADFVGGELLRSREVYQRGYEQCATGGAAAGLAWYASGLVRMATLDGRLADAARLGAQMAGIGSDLAIPAARQVGQAGRAIALAMLGRADDATAALDGVPPSNKPVYRFEIDRAHGWLHVANGRTARAVSALEEAAEFATSSHLVHNAALARLDLVRLGRGAAQAGPLAALRATSQGHFVPAAADAAAAIAEDDAEGLLGVADRFESMGALLVAAELAALAAASHRRAGRGRAGAVAEQRCLGLRSRTDDARTPAFGHLSGDEPLTDREREVAELAARGLKNADIAIELFLSVRTVENHLQRTYRKLGVGGRHDLADALGMSGPIATE